jgi:hypothetical protein
MSHKKFGARQSPAFRDIYPFVRRFQIWFLTAFTHFLPCLTKNGQEFKIVVVGNGMLW